MFQTIIRTFTPKKCQILTTNWIYDKILFVQLVILPETLKVLHHPRWCGWGHFPSLTVGWLRKSEKKIENRKKLLSINEETNIVQPQEKISNTQGHARSQTDGHVNSMTKSAQGADLVKMLERFQRNFLYKWWLQQLQGTFFG